MRLCWPRVTLRRLMLVVAFAAIGAAVWVLRDRARQYGKKANQYATMKRRQVQALKSTRHASVGWRAGQLRWMRREIRRERAALTALRNRQDPDDRAVDALVTSIRHSQHLAALFESRNADREGELSELEANIEYYATLEAMYERAAERPWLTPAPEPARPGGELRVGYWCERHDYRRVKDSLDELLQRRPSAPFFYHELMARTLAACPDAACRDGKQAVEFATRACELTGWEWPYCLDALAAAYAEAGDFAAAILWETEALDRQLLKNSDRQAFQSRLALYRQGKPYRENPMAE